MMRGYITRRSNGLFVITKFKPQIIEVKGTNKQDVYVTYGDPVSIVNVNDKFINSVYKSLNIGILQPTRTILVVNRMPYTHMLKLQENGLYTICSKFNEYIRLVDVCPWFIEKMFNVSELQEPFLLVHVSGELV